MDSVKLREHLERLDVVLGQSTELCIYGSAALMLLGQDDRISLDIDVAGAYSSVNETALAAAGRQIGLPVNPPEDYLGDHLEWISPLRLCLAVPSAEGRINLWRGSHLVVFTLPPSDLVASKLIRYDPLDQSDIQFLMLQNALRYEDIAQAVDRLPPAFRHDVVVRKNLGNLKHDAARWLP